ncbi:uncharacterized protein LOC108166728 [Poecilia reticulata]|uniref:uncharacterized protein LOC108166728 n=1 Tax=Poecilia reticulata TaxID=8081 RepID=UPI0007EAD2C4|nr:PREDICTED: uncharacterized protein LOC108166728 [Poecilia reticulata]
MIVDANVRFEALSALLGTKITSLSGGNPWKAAPALSVDDFFIQLILNKKTSYAEEFFIDEKEFFDPGYDFDFTNLSDSAACMRGNEPYVRPKGWYRMALKVRGKYLDGDAWLGTNGWRSYSVPGEWPVSYHGTGLEGARGIIRTHYKAGDGQQFGRGIYSTPKLNEAEKYCKTFKSKFTGKTYKVIMQNRIKPEKRQIIGNYWLIPVLAGTSAEEEKRIAESSIRPYGVLIKEM